MANAALARTVAIAEQVDTSAAIQWIARAKAMGWTGEVLEERNAPASAVRYQKALTSSVFEAIGAGPIKAFAEQAAPQSAFLRLVSDGGFQSAPLRTPLIRASADATAALVGEGQNIPITDITFAGESLTPEKAAAIVIATDEAWADITGAGQQYVNSMLRRAVGKVADARMFEVLEASPALEFTALRSDSAAITVAFQSMLAALLKEAGQRFRWVLSPEAAAALAPMSLGDRVKIGPDGGQIFDIPAGLTSNLPAGDLVLIRTSDVAARLIDLEIDASGETTLDVGAGEHVSMYQTNGIAVRVIIAYALQPLVGDVMARLTLTEV